MKILVLVKEVPEMTKVKFNFEQGVIDRASAGSEINPFDLNALQAAVDIKQICEAYITVLTMGPVKSEKSVRDAYARGADEGILLTDRKFGGSDTFATAMTLSAAIKAIGNYDLIICGEKSVDGDTAQVGGETAELLNIPHAYYVNKIEKLTNDEITVSIEDICGCGQLRKMKLPALIGVTKNISMPLLPTVNRKLKSLEIDIKKISLDELQGYISEYDTGFKGSPTKVSKIEIPSPVKRESYIFRDDYKNFKEVMEHKINNKRR